MGSIEGLQIVGQYMHPLIDQDTKNNDPWQRNYFQPPKFEKLVPRTSPLIDVRPEVSDPEYVPADLLKSHGFGVVKHSSALLEQPYVQEELTEKTIAEVYHPEIRELLTKTLGVKHIFVMASIMRRGTRVPEAFKMPTGLPRKPLDENEPKQEAKGQDGKLASQASVTMAAPVRVPHLDFTPLGARQSIRSQDRDIYNTAVECGVIAAEDKICENHPFAAQSKESDAFIAEKYNQNGKLGPRYAAFSIWRPLKRVGRDPLTLSPRRNSPSTNGDYVYWPYENKIPGQPEFSSDYLREYAMLGVQAESPVSNSDSSNSLQWYYISEQEPDEVLFIKLFDSAALGEDAQDAGAPWHGSPEIGTSQGDQPRESIELRVLAFW